jgi:hypothetical protein
MTITTITWTLHVKHHLSYLDAMTYAYSSGGVEASVSGLTFGAAQVYRASYATLKSVTAQHYAGDYSAS